MYRFAVTLLALCAIAAPLFTAQPAAAEAREWQIDPPHSYVYFDTVHIFSTTRGQFEKFDFTFRFDPEDLAGSSISLEIDVQSLTTHVTKRDNHLRSDDFFEVAKFPTITFTSTSIAPAGSDQYTVEGDLTVKDVTKRITVPMTFHGVKDHPLMENKQVSGFDVAFTMNRLDYGVGTGKFYDLGVVDKDVNVFVSLELLD